MAADVDAPGVGERDSSLEAELGLEWPGETAMGATQQHAGVFFGCEEKNKRPRVVLKMLNWT